MNKAQLIDEISKKTGLSKKDSRKALDALLKVIKESIAKGERIQLLGFGSFSVSERSSRTGRNPQTGQKISIPKKNIAKFRSGAELSKKIQKGTDDTGPRRH